MKFYITSVNGEVATIAHLDDDQAEALRHFVAKQQEAHPSLNIRLIYQDTVATDLARAEAELESEIDSWLL